MFVAKMFPVDQPGGSGGGTGTHSIAWDRNDVHACVEPKRLSERRERRTRCRPQLADPRFARTTPLDGLSPTGASGHGSHATLRWTRSLKTSAEAAGDRIARCSAASRAVHFHEASSGPMQQRSLNRTHQRSWYRR